MTSETDLWTSDSFPQPPRGYLYLFRHCHVIFGISAQTEFGFVQTLKFDCWRNSEIDNATHKLENDERTQMRK